MQIDYCYHTHTARCGHASGTDREVVEAAIKAGVKELGFSDHVFLPNFPQPGVRGDYKLLEDYISSIRSLADEYKDKIKIYVGFEAEYAKCLEPYYKKLLEDGTIDYLICGQHLFFETPEKGEWIFRDSNLIHMAKKYVKTIKNAIKSGLFKYIAHPDLFMCDAKENHPYYKKAMYQICKCAKKYDIPLEINLHGIINRRNHEPSEFRYPCKNFFMIAKEVGNKIIIGPDVHNPDEFEHSVINEAEYIINEVTDQLINRIDIK